MPKEYTKEELRKLLEKLPEELKEALFSEKTTEAVYNVCDRNEIPEEKIPQISECVGRVFLGVLPIDDFQRTLEGELKLNAEKAKKVTSEMFHFVFYPVKEVLAILYAGEIKPPERPSAGVPPVETPGVQPLKEKIKKELEVPRREDVYREPVE